MIYPTSHLDWRYYVRIQQAITLHSKNILYDFPQGEIKKYWWYECSPPPPEIIRFFLKSEGKEIERKRKNKGCWGGGYLLTYFWSWYFFEWGWDIFRGVEKFSGGVENFSGGGGWEIYFRVGWEFFGGLRNFRGGVEKFFLRGEGWEFFWGGGLRNFRRG